MKKTAFIFLIIMLLFMISVPIKACAEKINDIEIEYNDQIDVVMDEYDIGIKAEEAKEVTISGMTDKIISKTDFSKRKAINLLVTIILVTVLTAILKTAGSGLIKNSSDIYSSVCTLTAAAVIAPELSRMFINGVNAVKLSGGFISAFIPVYAGITAVSGGAVTAGVYDITVLTASELIVNLSCSFLMPLLSAATLLSVTGSVCGNANFSGTVNIIKKAVTWLLTSAMLLFTGYTNLKCTLAGKADGAATKTARFIISGLVPVIGGAVSDAYTTVRSSLLVIQGTAGAAGNIAVILIIMPVLLQIVVFRLIMCAGAAVSDIFDEGGMTKLLRSFDSTLAIIQSVLVCYGMMFILCTAALMKNTGW